MDNEKKEAIKVTPEEIKIFFKDRPLISVKGFERECNLPFYTIANFLKDERGLPEKHIDTIIPLMEHYGYAIN